MDWRDRTYYWVRLNYNSRPLLIYKAWDYGGRNYERRVKELKKIPGLKMHPLPSMALDREKREKVPEWAQMLVSCRRAHDMTLVNCFTRFAAEPYGNCEWQIVEEAKGEKPMKKAIKEFKIRNSAGVLTVRAERELSLRDVFQGMGDDKLPEMERPRLELHKNERYNGWLVTLSDRDCEGTMYVLEFSDFGDGVKAYLGEYDVEVPDKSYVTMEPWREG